MSLTEATQLYLRDTALNGKTLQLSYYGKLGGLSEILTIEVPDSEEVIVSIPVKKLDDVKKLDKTNYSGIYFLKDNGKTLYIGQASNQKLKQRLREHSGNKDWWNRCIFVTKTNNNLDAADLNYLESTFIEKAKETGTNLDNSTKGNTSWNISEEKKESLNSFIENVLSVLKVVGINIFLDKKDIKEENAHREWSKEISEEKFYLKSRGCDAKIVWRNEDEVIVQKGSELADYYQDNEIGDKVKSDRRRYSDSIEGKIVKKDIHFETLNEAATFCNKGTINVWTSLKNKEGKSLDEVCKEIYANS